MAGFGTQLRQERERRGLTLEQIAETTRINPRYLKALEADDLSKLPGSVFNKGYVRAYAVAIGADPDPLIEAYSGEERAQQAAGRIERQDALEDLAQVARRSGGSRAETTAKGWMGPALVVVGLLVVIAAGWGIVRRFGGDDEAPSAASLQARVDESMARRAGESVSPGEATPPAASAADSVGTPGRDRPAPVTAPDTPEPASATPPETDRGSAVAAPAKVASATIRPRQTATVTPEPAAPPPTAPSEDTAPAESPRANSATVPAPTQSTVSITEYGVGSGVANRALVGESERFAPGAQVWFWNRVLGGRRGQRIRHIWLHEGRTISSTELELGGAHWRTQSRKTLRREGRWAVEARDASGRVLARSDFVCAASDG